jgi:hypothetical protein
MAREGDSPLARLQSRRRRREAPAYPPILRPHQGPRETLKVNLDTRPNGPAIAAFEIASGDRPLRFGSTNRWSIHHIYSGKFPYIDRFESLHATKSGVHFTQSAGLLAMHPIADAMSDEYPFFAWYLRALAYERFGYDPDQVFSSDVDGWKRRLRIDPFSAVGI